MAMNKRNNYAPATASAALLDSYTRMAPTGELVSCISRL